LRELAGIVITTTPKPPADDDRKLFVGGLNFKDLENKDKYPTLSPAASLEAKYDRIKHYFALFEQFGPVAKKKDYILTKRHCFIIYETKESCDKALATLSNFEERQRICREFKEKILQTSGKQAKAQVPTPHFYVRSVNVLKKKR